MVIKEQIKVKSTALMLKKSNGDRIPRIKTGLNGLGNQFVTIYLH